METHTYYHGFLDMVFKLEVPLPRYIEGREQVSNKPHEDLHVICDNLGEVEVTQCSH